ncbi:MAG TPA: uridine kinase [Victivallales bacterium]|nr:uridine kinase [Victivallales bacterium]
MDKQETIFIGIEGGSASGKTTVVNKIMHSFKNNEIEQIELDSYYNDFSNLTPEERDKLNFDHPKAFDFDLLTEHINILKKGKPIEKPIYDFATHLRIKDTITVYPKKIIIIEGILIFAKKELRNMLDVKIYVDTAADIRLMRRIERDIEARGRTLDSVKNQYFNTVRPMHLEFIEPTKQFADIIVPRGGNNHVAINMIISRIKYLLNHA